MNIWANAVITQKGLALQAKLIEGTSLKIVEVEIGAGYVTPGLLNQQTAVSDPKKTIEGIRSISYPEDGKCAATINLTNDDVDTGYTAKQVGFYANDPDEGKILYFIAQAESGTGTVIPSKTEMPGYSAEWTFYFQYGHADGVEVTVDPSNTVSQEAMEIYVKNYVEEALRGKADADHSHEQSDVNGLEETLQGKADADLSNVDDSAFLEKASAAGAGGIPVVTTAGDGTAYTATVKGASSLKVGMTVTIIPHVASASATPTLDINSLGSKEIRQPVSSDTESSVAGESEGWLVAGKPITVMYDGTYWIAQRTRASATGLHGIVPVKSGGTGAATAESARANIGAASIEHKHQASDISGIPNNVVLFTYN